MDALRGLTLLLLCQSAGEALARVAGVPLPAPVIGLLLLLVALQWAPLRRPVEAIATPLLGHLSLLFVPVGVGVIAHLGLLASFGGRMMVALVLSTWIGLWVTATVLRLGWPPEDGEPDPQASSRATRRS